MREEGLISEVSNKYFLSHVVGLAFQNRGSKVKLYLRARVARLFYRSSRADIIQRKTEMKVIQQSIYF